MTTYVILIVLSSTVMHAGWNLLARFSKAETTFYMKMLVITSIFGFIPAVWSELVTRSMTQLAWLCVLGSGFCAGVYLFALGRAFESSDFTIVYPVARSLPVIFVAILDVMRGRFLTPIGWLGILMVVAGCVLVPLRSLSDLRLSAYLNRATLWMVTAAFGTVGYTLLDKIAAEVVQQGADTAARYGYFYFLISLVPYWGFVRMSKPAVARKQSDDWLLAMIAAIFGFGAYWLILWAYQLSPYASYIVAFRQFSIVIGAVVAFIVLKEPGIKVRLAGAGCITAGLVLIAGWGR